MAGKVYVVRDGVLRGEPFLDLAAARKGRFTSANLFEQGLATFAFHPDFAQPGRRGFLYIGVGDGGNTELVNNQVDDWQLAQNGRVPLGKILRIDPLADGRQPYGVPADNPFVGRAGANYGWGEREGTRMVKHGDSKYGLGLPFFDFVLGYTYPALVYGHHLGMAVTGGFVYRGDALPQLRGMYVFGDIASGRIFFADVQALDNGSQAAFYELPLVFQGKPGTLRQIVGAERADLRFGVDDRGEIHLLTKQDGMVRRLSALVPSEVSIWPVEYPVAPLEESWWGSVQGRVEATVRAVLRRR